MTKEVGRLIPLRIYIPGFIRYMRSQGRTFAQIAKGSEFFNPETGKPITGKQLKEWYQSHKDDHSDEAYSGIATPPWRESSVSDR